MASVTKSGRQSNTFRITFTIGADEYAVVPLLDADPCVVWKAFRFTKLTGDQAVYDVALTKYGPECDCKGFVRWQKPCKHIRTLTAAGMLELTAKPRKPTPAVPQALEPFDWLETLVG